MEGFGGYDTPKSMENPLSSFLFLLFFFSSLCFLFSLSPLSSFHLPCLISPLLSHTLSSHPFRLFPFVFYSFAPICFIQSLNKRILTVVLFLQSSSPYNSHRPFRLTSHPRFRHVVVSVVSVSLSHPCFGSRFLWRRRFLWHGLFWRLVWANGRLWR